MSASDDIRGLDDTLSDIIDDLQDHDPLIDLVDDPDRIFRGYPTDERAPVAVILTPIYDGSTPHRGAVTRTYRVQVSVVSTLGWREQRQHDDATPDNGGFEPGDPDAGMSAMYEIVDRVADRLDRSKGLKEIPLGNERGPFPEPRDDGRLVLASDWRIRGTYVTD